MSDHREVIVALGVAAEDAAQFAARLDSWLTDAGWSGAAALEQDWLAEDARPTRSFSLEGEAVGTVSVDPERRGWACFNGFESPGCPSCGQLLPDDDEMALLGDWEESGVEPAPVCSRCGFTAPVGDWDVTTSGVFGGPALVVDLSDAPDRSPDEVRGGLRTAVAEQFGGRWAEVALHL